MKTCNCCKEEKSFEEFPKDKSRKDGYSYICKLCSNKKNETWRLKNGEEYNRLRREEPDRIKKRRVYDRNRLKILVEENPDYIRNSNLLNKFGITAKEYDKMLQESGGCEICGISQEQSIELFGIRLAVDHCHTTNKIRGLLCVNCNSALGKFKDSEELLLKAVEYIKRKV